MCERGSLGTCGVEDTVTEEWIQFEECGVATDVRQVHQSKVSVLYWTGLVITQTGCIASLIVLASRSIKCGLAWENGRLGGWWCGFTSWSRQILLIGGVRGRQV